MIIRNPNRRERCRAGLALFLVVAASSPGAAVGSDFARFSERAANSAEQIDHDLLDVFLERLAVEDRGRLKVAYATAGEQGELFLAEYARRLSGISPAVLNADEQLAYWLNLRTALILAEFSGRKGRADLLKLRGDFANPGEMWTAKKATVDGAPLSIDEIERHIILANWRDPRVLYGLYQASATGPELRAKAFRGATVWQELESSGRSFVAQQGARVRKDRLEAPAIYAWYKDALFGGDDAAIKAHIATFSKASERPLIESASMIGYGKFLYRVEKYEVRNTRPEIANTPAFDPSGS